MNEPENVVKISHHREPYTFYERAAELLLDKTFNFNTIYLKAIGNAIPTALYVAEFLHRRVDGLHQVSDITRTSFTEEYEAIEEGLENKTLTRYVSTLSIKLTTEPAEEDYKSPGYQGPLESDEKQIKHLLQISKTVAHIRDRQEGGRYNRSGRRGDNRGDRSRISERRGYQHNLGEDSDGDNRQDREQGYKKRFPNEEWSPRSRGNRGVFRIFGPKEDHDRRREGSRDGENRRDGEREDKDFVRRGSGRVFVADR
jgi:DNA-binding protein